MTGSRRKIISSDKEKISEKKKLNQNVAMKKVRIIYNDPDATDSSSDDESNVQTNEYGKRVKRVVREVIIPMDTSSEGTQMSVGVGGTKKCYNSREPTVKKLKVPIIYNDPDATDSSSYEENNVQKNEYVERVKRVAREAFIPTDNSIEGARMLVGVGSTQKNSDSGEPAVKKLRGDYPYGSLMKFREPVVINKEESLQQLIENGSAPPRQLEPDFTSLGSSSKEGTQENRVDI